MAPTFICKFCEKSFVRNFCLKRHLRKVHNLNLENVSLARSNFSCPLCQEKLKKYSDFIKHSSDKHDITIKNKKIEFKNEKEFLMWKNDIEKESNTYFYKRTSSLRADYKKQFFYCNRSGFYHSTLVERKREIKKQGSRKINGFCPCSLKVYFFDDGKVKVDYCSTHVGHTVDVQHLPLTLEERQAIAIQIRNNIPYDVILANVRSSIGTKDCDRIHLLTKQDLRNIKAEFGLNDDIVFHSKDPCSVDAWVREELMSDNNCILLYKPRNKTNYKYQFSALNKEDFILGIMTTAQEKVLKTFGNNTICIDTIHGLNSFDLELLILMVLDEKRQGIPCAFLLCSRIIDETIGAFISVIKDRVGTLEPSILMTDMTDLFYKGWLDIMGCVERPLYCIWHVDRDWQENLEKIKVQEKQAEAYNKLRSLLEETNKEAFSRMLGPVVKSLCSNDETKKFGHYFNDKYGGCCKQWAYCYRKDYGININMNLGTLHRTIKQLYSKRKAVKLPDKSVHIIVQFIKENLSEYSTFLEKELVTPEVNLTSLQTSTNSIFEENVDLSTNEVKGCEEKSLSLKKITSIEPEVMKSHLLERFIKTIDKIMTKEEFKMGQQAITTLEINLKSLK
uniref:C2H2-type domain-containing protein n=1 Tax=Clastoptera arizonana TaxID=38151 RepID=A0A1B6CG27_9HEMI